MGPCANGWWTDARLWLAICLIEEWYRVCQRTASGIRHDHFLVSRCPEPRQHANVHFKSNYIRFDFAIAFKTNCNNQSKSNTYFLFRFGFPSVFAAQIEKKLPTSRTNAYSIALKAISLRATWTYRVTAIDLIWLAVRVCVCARCYVNYAFSFQDCEFLFGEFRIYFWLFSCVRRMRTVAGQNKLNWTKTKIKRRCLLSPNEGELFETVKQFPGFRCLLAPHRNFIHESIASIVPTACLDRFRSSGYLAIR